MDIDKNVQGFRHGFGPKARDASFDYCYNYFQSFYESGNVQDLSIPINMQQSCLQIGFYLASWGMFRGAALLSRKSIKFYEPLIQCIATSDPRLWQIDVDNYTQENIDLLMDCDCKIATALREGREKEDTKYVSITLVTKIMLGVYGNIPAFDKYFKDGMEITWEQKQRQKTLEQVASLYQKHKEAINSYDIATLDFATGQNTSRKYTKAKILDMAGFNAGQEKAILNRTA
jgi:hypothetical protein